MNKRIPKTVLFFSPQGGSGKTTLAINYSIFASCMGLKTLIIDMSPFGSIMSALRITGKNRCGLSSVITSIDLNDSIKKTSYIDEFESNITNAVNENYFALTNANPVNVESMKEKYIKIIFDTIKELDYDVIFIDTTSELNVKNIVMIGLSDLVIIPVLQDINCGWRVIKFREIISKCYRNSDKMKLVVNMCSKYSGFNNLEFETECGYSIMDEIPYYDKNYQTYLNQGIFINSIKNKKAYNKFLSSTKIALKFVGI